MTSVHSPGPSMQVYSTEVTSFSLPYAFLFIFGTAGNVAVLTYVFFVTRSLRSSVTALGNTFVYMVVLSGVDLLVTMSIPFHLSVMVLENWIFGQLACKIYFLLELSNKICSSFILTALAFDRYMAICHPEMKRVHQMRQTAAIVTGMICISTILIAPVVFSAYVKEFHSDDIFTRILEKKPKAETITYPIVKQMCVDGLSITMKFWFLCAMVVVAFLLPCTLLTYFYVRIILRLRRQIRTMLQSRIPIKRITIYTLVVTLFYLACQIPYWLPQIYLIFAKIFRLSLSRDFIKITYVAHMLPFLAAAFNWIFYAQLNSQFKKGLILVTERMHRKMTRTGTKRVADTMDELCIEMMSRSEEAPNCVCPNCEHPLSIKVQKISTSVNGNNASHV
ncbi:unnamed protein product, partial [Mesorhabditis belari]|uniref:G-protein coupled receptors family 1 profile domain-containing protein n=1 Tax=Mesorhabditis belari TaxID=2138241 RepID=A0AAF3EMP7_9BILA